MAEERELDERTLEDEEIDEEQGCRPEPVDDAVQAEYVNSLTLPQAEPQRTPSDGTASAVTSQEPGNERGIAQRCDRR